MTAITTANVSEAFDEAADRYDLMVGLNPGYHDHLRSAAEALAERLPQPSGGQRGRRGAAGRPRLRLGRLHPGAAATPRRRIGVRATIVGVDASAGMLDQARAKSWPPGVTLRDRHGRGARLRRESWGLGDRVPGVFAAYLFRNVTERDKVLAAVFDLLADDGTFVVQEYSVAGSPTGRRRLVAGLLDGGHPAELADLPADPALPLPVAQRAAVRLGRRPSSTGSTGPVSSTSRCVRCPAGSAASCTPSAPASRRRRRSHEPTLAARAGRPRRTPPGGFDPEPANAP